MRLTKAITLSAALFAACFPFLLHYALPAQAAAEPAAAYAANGDLLPVGNYREWIYLTSGVDMSYSPKPADMTMFDNVFVNPDAYRNFLRQGRGLTRQSLC